MPQFFMDRDFNPGEEICLTGADARHISQSLRLGSGDWLVLSDGCGRSFRSEIISAAPGRVTAKILDEILRSDGALPPTLALAIIKGDRFEWAISKAVELGCRRIRPFLSTRTVIHLFAGQREKKLARWRKIARESAMQSGLPFEPLVEEPTTFGELLIYEEGRGQTAMFFEGERKEEIASWWKKRRSPKEGEADLIIIGPEGGFTADEVKAARKAGAATISLGRQILRVETAAVAALALWQYELGNMGA